MKSVWPATANLLIAATGIAISVAFLSPLPALFHGLLLPVTVAIARSDFRRYLIDNRDLGWIFVLGLCFVVAQALSGGQIINAQSIAMALIQAAGRAIAIYAFFWLINLAYRYWRGTTGIAAGDLILFASAGIWLPFDAFPVFLLLACAGAISAVIVRNRRRGRKLSTKTYVPFGGFLGISLWLTVLSV